MYERTPIKIIENPHDPDSLIFYIIYKNIVNEVIIDKDEYSGLFRKFIYVIGGYAYIRFYNDKNQYYTQSVHEYIYGRKNNYDDHECIDHINRNKLDNRKKNLRGATRLQNSYNISVINSISGVIGVRVVEDKFQAYLIFNEYEYTGLFNVKEDAMKVRDIHILKYHKEFGVLNYDDLLELYTANLEEPLFMEFINSFNPIEYLVKAVIKPVIVKAIEPVIIEPVIKPVIEPIIEVQSEASKMLDDIFAQLDMNGNLVESTSSK